MTEKVLSWPRLIILCNAMYFAGLSNWGQLNEWAALIPFGINLLYLFTTAEID